MWYHLRIYDDNWSGHRCGRGKEVASIYFEADNRYQAYAEAEFLTENEGCTQFSLKREEPEED